MIWNWQVLRGSAKPQTSASLKQPKPLSNWKKSRIYWASFCKSLLFHLFKESLCAVLTKRWKIAINQRLCTVSRNCHQFWSNSFIFWLQMQEYDMAGWQTLKSISLARWKHKIEDTNGRESLSIHFISRWAMVINQSILSNIHDFFSFNSFTFWFSLLPILFFCRNYGKT